MLKSKKKKLESAKLQRLLETRRNLLSPKSDFFLREAYKTLRTNVSFALAGDHDSKVVIITSSHQGEGKSITTINLAISYAMTDRKVLVIDCDLRRPKLARILNLGNKTGLSNLLLEPDLLDNSIVHTGTPNLDVILSGRIPPNPSELLSSPRMLSLLEQLKEQYDLIFLDTPPVNMVTDAVVLAPVIDGVLFLVRANQADRPSVAYAVAQLEYAKAKILGFILNGVDMEKNYYGYGKRRYRRYFAYGKYGYSKYGYKYGYSFSAPSPYISDDNHDD